jgi:AraC-like DNA-binding protein
MPATRYAAGPCGLYLLPGIYSDRTITQTGSSKTLLTCCYSSSYTEPCYDCLTAPSVRQPSFIFKGHGIPDSFRSIIVIHACVYHFYCWRLSQKLLLQETYSEYVQNKISWIHDFFRNAVIIFTLFIVFHTLRTGFLGYTQVGSSVITPLLLLLSYFLILHKSFSYLPVFSGTKEFSTEIPKKSEDKKPLPAIDDEQLALLAEKLTEAMELEQLFKNQALSLNSLSAHLDIQPRMLSQFIHQHYQTNFSDFINKYRVEESRSMMQNPAMNHLKLEAIAEASGFTSRASFFSIFKKVTGLTPAMFRKEHAS